MMQYFFLDEPHLGWTSETKYVEALHNALHNNFFSVAVLDVHRPLIQLNDHYFFWRENAERFPCKELLLKDKLPHVQLNSDANFF